MRKSLKYFALIVTGMCMLVTIAILYYRVPAWIDPQGESNGSCDSQAIPSISNRRDMIVSGHYTVCDNIIHNSAFYIYLHRSGEPENSQSLVFRYADDPTTPGPQISWRDPITVSISVGNVIQITKLVRQLDGINVVYSIGKQELGQDVWMSWVRTSEVIGLVLLVMLGLMAVLCFAIVRSIRNERRA